MADGDHEIIITVWTPKSSPEVSVAAEVFFERVKVSRPQGKVVASLSLTARNSGVESQSNKTIGSINILASGTLGKPAETRTQLNEPWQKPEYKD